MSTSQNSVAGMFRCGTKWLMLRLAVSLVGLPLSGQAADMRDCRLDDVTFVDYRTDLEFEVTRFGQEEYFVCVGTAGVEERSDADTGECRGPFGRRVLQGHIIDPNAETEQAVIAQYSVILALPCCGWEVFSPEEWRHLDKGIEWFPEGTAPTLGSQQFVSIYEMNGRTGFKNEMIALVCGHDLP